MGPIKIHNGENYAHAQDSNVYRAPIIWKLLPNEIKNSKSLNDFKIKIKNWKPNCDCRLCKTYIANLGFI